MAVVAMLAAAVLGGCRGAAPSAEVQARHVVLVTLDTLRADHLGVYGGDVATPHLDRLAAEGALFRHVTAHVPLTRPSHVSMFTGLLPTETGVRDNVSPTTVPDVPLLAEVLAGAGFRTAAFVSAVVLSGGSGLDRGFDHYSDELEADPDDPRFLSAAQRRGDETLELAVAWMEEILASGTAGASERTAIGPTAEQRLFVWIHLYDPHEPYVPPEPYASQYTARPYAGEVAWTDELVGRLDRELERLGLRDDTLLAVTSDHGEGLGEHDELLHGFFAYQSTLAVPLLLRGPGVVAGREVTAVAGLVDLYPTLLELAGVDLPADVRYSGQSLAGLLRGEGELSTETPGDRVLYAETLVPRLRFGWSDLRVARDRRWKLIRAPRPELYDLDSDPQELVNVLQSSRGQARRLSAALDGFLAAEGSTTTTGSLPEEQLAQLRALGYLGSSAAASTVTPGADPKDKIEDFRIANDLTRRGLDSLRRRQFEAAAAAFGELIDRQIESAETRLYLGRALLGLGRLQEAAASFERAAVLEPTRASGWLGLAESRLSLGDGDGALAALRDGAGFSPQDGRLWLEQGRALRLLGRPAEAREAFVAALPLLPEDALLRVLLGETERALGDLDAAIAGLREAVRMAPETAGYWNTLGMTLGGADRLQDSEAAFREACRLDESSHLYAFNLGLLLLRQQRPQEARQWLERTLQLESSFAPARERLQELLE